MERRDDTQSELPSSTYNTIDDAEVIGPVVQAQAIRYLNFNTAPQATPRSRLWEERLTAYQAFVATWDKYSAFTNNARISLLRAFDHNKFLRDSDTGLSLVHELRSAHTRIALLDGHHAPSKAAVDAACWALREAVQVRMDLESMKRDEENAWRPREYWEALTRCLKVRIQAAENEATGKFQAFCAHASAVLGTE